MIIRYQDTNTGNVPAAGPLPAKAGIGLKPEHFQQIIEQQPGLGFFEIHAENYLVEGGPMLSGLQAIRERYPISVHGVGMSIGSSQPLNQHHLKQVAGLVERYQPHAFSEHLAWSTHDGVFLNDLLPLPYNEATLLRVCNHIDQIQNVLRRPMLLENPTSYLEFRASTMSETAFISEVIRRTGCGLLLDVNNLYISAVNHNRDPQQMLQELPLKQVGEIHLAGYAENVGAAGERLLIDSHDTAVSDPVWELYDAALILTGAVATLIEWDNNIPPLARLLLEADRAEQRMKQGKTMHQLISDALLDPESPLPEGLMVWNGSDPTVRFGVYRNNVIASLIDALAENYPVLQSQVGEDYFRAMAAEFVRQHPPSSAVLAYYGEGLPAWIAMFPPLAGWPWLADLTALEFSFITALHTADNETDDKTFNRVVNPQVDGLLLDCSLRVISSSYAIYQIWIAHKTGIPLANIDPFEPESVILFRQGNDMMVMPVSPAQAQFVRALLAGKTLMHSLEAGQGCDARFEPEDTLLQLHRYGLIVGLKECVC